MSKITIEGVAEKIDGFKDETLRRLDEGNDHFKRLNGNVEKHGKAITKIATRQNTHSYIIKTFCGLLVLVMAAYLIRMLIP